MQHTSSFGTELLRQAEPAIYSASRPTKTKGGDFHTGWKQPVSYKYRGFLPHEVTNIGLTCR